MVLSIARFRSNNPGARPHASSRARFDKACRNIATKLACLVGRILRSICLPPLEHYELSRESQLEC